MKYSIGVDLGGTNIKVGIVNEAYEIVGRSSVKTGMPAADTVIADRIAEAVRLACEDAGISLDDAEHMGIGTPGAADRSSGVVLYSNNLHFKNTDLRSLLSERLGKVSYVENDANAAVYGEMLAGSAAGYRNVLLLTLGTGVGGGVIINGKIFAGSNNFGAELGHVVVEFGGKLCTCGRKGCLESYASATGLISMTKEAMEADKSSALWTLAGSLDGVNGKTAFDGMRAGDKTGAAVVDRYLAYLGCGIANMVNVFQPEIVLLGGGICKEGEYLTKPLEAIMHDQVFGKGLVPVPKLDIAKLGNDAGIIGAAFLYRQED